MKTIFLLFLLLFTGFFTGLFAQNRVVRKVESMRDYYKKDFSLEYSRYVQCSISDEYETDINASGIDTVRYIRLQLLPPHYDSTEVDVKIEDSYMLFTIENNAATKKINIAEGKIQLLPPLYKLTRVRRLIDSLQSYFEPIKGDANAISQNPSECFAFKFCNTTDVSLYFYKKEIIKPARIINAKNDTIVLAADSPYFQYFKKTVIPEKKVAIRQYKEIKSCMIEHIDSFVVVKIQGKTRVRKGGWSELKRFFICGPMSTNRIPSIQLALKAKGFYKGKPSGVIDAKTKKALIAFQKAYKLNVGSLDLQTLRALNYEKYDTPIEKSLPYTLTPTETAFYEKHAQYAKHRWNNAPKLLFDPNTEAIKTLFLLGEDPLLQGFSVEQVRAAKGKK
jgi:Putative peptidoglycan binding domain